MRKTCGALVMVSALSAVPALSTGPALAGDPSGVWKRDNGEAKIRVGKCSNGLCGRVVWVQDPKRKGDVGKIVLDDMVGDGPNSWVGKAYNPLDEKTYTGKMTLSGNTLTTSGCIMGGMMCKSMSWMRSSL
jgi:uncharacterized protein (DUF2147 family)